MALKDKLNAAQAEGKKLNLTFEQIATLQQQISDNAAMTGPQIRKAAAEAAKFADNMQQVRDIEYTILDLTSSLQKPYEKILNATQQQLDNEINLAKAMKQKIAAQVKAGTLSKSLAKEMKLGLDATIKMNKAMQTIAGRKDLAAALAAGSDAADNVQSSVDGIFANIPGGSAVQKMFGFHKIGEDIKGEMISGLIAFNASGKGSIGIFGSLKLMVQSITKVLMANPLVAVLVAATALVGVMGTLVGIAGKFEASARAAAEAQGTTVSAMKQQALEAHKVSMSTGMTLANSEDILSVQSRIADQMGSSYMMSAQVAGEIAETGKAFGIGVQASADFSANLMESGATAGETQQMLQGIGAELLGTGINAGAVIEDITKNARLTGKYFKGSVKQLKKAAIEAAKMGVSLDTMAAVSDSLLDIEGSLSAQFEYQALTGKSMNLDKARQLALQGKTAEATKEMLKQVGSLSDLQGMLPMEMAALEKATGMTADQMMRSAQIQEQLPKMKEEEIKLLEAQGLSIDQIAKMDQGQRQTALADVQAQAKMQKNMDKMKAKMMKALLPIAEALLEAFSAMSPVLSTIGSIFGMILSPVTKIVKFIGQLTGFLSENYGILVGIGALVATEMALRKKVAIATGIQNTKDAITKGYKSAIAVITSKELIKQKASNAMATAKGVIEKSVLGTYVLQMGQKAAMFVKDTAMNALATARKAIEYGTLTIQYAINAAKTISNVIAMGGIAPMLAAAGAAVAAAIPSIFTGFGMIPFGLGIPLAFATVAGLIALIASMSKGDDVISGAAGGSGYGKRVLFGPEGAISFNNKDTIVAGTDLFGKMNDGIIAPPGAMKVDDYAEGEPAEANVVQLSNDAAKKLGYAVQMGQKGLLGNLFGGGSEPAPTQLGEETIVKQVAGFGLALTTLVPALTAGMTAAIIAGNLATALIPKPVLIMNPVLPVIETNPILIGAAMLDMMGGFFGSLFGGGGEKEDPNAKIVAKLDEVIVAVSNIQINMDGEKVGALTRIADSFRSRTRS